MGKKMENPGLEQTLLQALSLPIEIRLDKEELSQKKKTYEARYKEVMMHAKKAYDWINDNSWQWKDTFPTFETLLEDLEEKLRGGGAL